MGAKILVFLLKIMIWFVPRRLVVFVSQVVLENKIEKMLTQLDLSFDYFTLYLGLLSADAVVSQEDKVMVKRYVDAKNSEFNLLSEAILKCRPEKQPAYLSLLEVKRERLNTPVIKKLCQEG